MANQIQRTRLLFLCEQGKQQSVHAQNNFNAFSKEHGIGHLFESNSAGFRWHTIDEKLAEVDHVLVTPVVKHTELTMLIDELKTRPTIHYIDDAPNWEKVVAKIMGNNWRKLAKGGSKS